MAQKEQYGQMRIIWLSHVILSDRMSICISQLKLHGRKSQLKISPKKWKCSENQSKDFEVYGAGNRQIVQFANNFRELNVPLLAANKRADFNAI